MRNAVLSTLLISGIVLLTAIFAGFYFILKRPQPPLKTAEVKIGQNVFAVEVASTTIERMLGLSGRDGLEENEGMFFIFDTSGNYGFWMKGMKFPIDIIWIAHDKVVGFAENAMPETGKKLLGLKIYDPPKPINRVLEVNAGTVKKHGIKIGDSVQFSAP